jgi:hypothetical protein
LKTALDSYIAILQKMEQMMEHLLGEMKAHREKLVAMIKTGQEQMRAKMEVHQEWIEATIEAWLEKMGVNQEKSEVKTEASQEKIEAIAEPYEWVPRVKAMHPLTAPQHQASDVLHGVSKGVMYKETNGAPEERFGDQHLAPWYRNPLKTWIRDDGEPLQEFAATIKQLTHCTFPALHKNHIHRGLGIKQQLRL